MGALSAGLLALIAAASVRLGARAQVDVARDNVAQNGELELPALFSDHLVLQAETIAPLWGRARPGARVELVASWDGHALAATADAAGRFRIELATPAAGGPFTLTFASGAAKRVLADVLVGEVWLASGQSNMQWTLGPVVGPGVEGWEEAARDARDPALRVFAVEQALAPAPLADVHGRWQAADPESARAFSAVAYFFARQLRHELGVPVGVITSDWGGTPCEAWTSAPALQPFPEFAAHLARQAEYARDPVKAEARLAELRRRYWEHALELDRTRGLAPERAIDAADGAEWREVALPATFEQHGLEAFDGLVWYRRTLALPAGWSARALVLELGAIDDRDTVFWNGARIGGQEADGAWETPRRYELAAGLAREGANELAVRVLDTGGFGGFAGPAEALRLQPADASAPALSLAGPWRWRAGTPLAELGLPPPDQPFGPTEPSVLWNAMIAPLAPAALRGVIWYQGEANCPRAGSYQAQFEALVRDWRTAFARAELPFYFVQIAPFAYPGDHGEAGALRDAQRRALELAHTGMAVTMDIGNPADIHPRKKREVGERLALWALAGTYGRALECAGPLYRAAKSERDALRLEFTHAAGLSSHGEPVRHLSIAGSDRVFHAAEGRIEGETLLVSSPEVSEPQAVRFGWGADDQTNLWNSAGLPAASFRTDDWP